MLGDDGELIPPAAFLPLAERFGLDRSEIDPWVTSSAIDLLATSDAGRRIARSRSTSPGRR